MAGHSKWKGIKDKKAVVDARRSKVWTKVIREITVAARAGSGDPESNPRLRVAVSKAREANMPKDTVEKAIKRGTGDLPGVSYEESHIEGYGPGGVAVYVESLTDNKNRTVAELRSIFTKHNSNIAGAGSVAWLFTKRGSIVVGAKGVNEDELLNLALEAGADDMTRDGESYAIFTDPHRLEAVKQALAAKQIAWESAEITMTPSSSVRVEDADQARQLLALLDRLEEHDDVQHVYANFDIPDSLLTTLTAA